MKRVCVLVLFLCIAHVSMGQSNSRKLAKSDTVLHFFAGFKLKEGLYVVTQADSTTFNKTASQFPVMIKMFEAANKPQILKVAATSLKKRRLGLENERANMFSYFATREELQAFMRKLEESNKNSVYYLSEYKFDKSFKNRMITMPEVK